MADFIVTDPSGKEFVVSAPEGATQEQALEYAKAQFSSTPSGAATGNPNIAAQGNRALPRQPSGFGEISAEIGTAGALGAAAGYAAPEILTGLGAAAGAFPVTAPAAPFLLGAGNIVRGARGTSAFAGAVGGAAGESLGQVVEAAGGSQPMAEAARFAGAGLTPEIGTGTIAVLKKYVTKPALSVVSFLKKEVAKVVLNKLEGDPKTLTQKEQEYLGTLIDELRGGAKSDDALKGVYGGLESGAQRARVTAEQEASSVIADAEREASKTLWEAARKSIGYREGRSRLAEIGDAAIRAAQNQRTAIGADKEVTDIGGGLRNVIVKRNESALSARAAQYKADEAARDAIVQQRQGAGQYVSDTPEYHAVLADLEAQLTPGKRSPDVARGFQKILSELRVPKAKQEVEGAIVGVSGKPLTSTTEPGTPLSFQALDDVRRKLGDVFKGNPAEGYDAIGEAAARKYYGMITNIQKRYAGEPQSRLLQQYADATTGLEMFGSRTGKKATALDRYNDAEFATDASALPRTYFKSQEGVQALQNLTGDKALVTQAAKDYATNQLRSADAAGVRSWLTKNSDWLKSLPEVQFSVGKYASQLERGERVAANTQRGIKIVAQKQAQRSNDAAKFAQEIRASADKRAGVLEREGARTADILTGDKFPAERVRNLIESGSPSQWEVAGPAIAASPSAKAQVSSAVRQVISDHAERNVLGLTTFFNERVRPAMEMSGLMPTRELDGIATQLAAIANLKLPEPAKLGMAKRVLLQSVGGYAATLGARGIVGGTSALVDQIPQ